jgi:hypothetical protein
MPRLRTAIRPTVALSLIALLCPVRTEAIALPCDEAAQVLLVSALRTIERSVDPCGESLQLTRLQNSIQDAPATYRICTDLQADRNSFNRDADGSEANDPRNIIWNPALRTQLELGCDGDPTKPVLRDPIASLVHELVHAAQDADGLDPTEHEFDAVRVENIYRRAAGICQRAHYGSVSLPLQMVKACEPGECLCTAPADRSEQRLVQLAPSSRMPGDAESAPPRPGLAGSTAQ